jgi:hypothetical protein
MRKSKPKQNQKQLPQLVLFRGRCKHRWIGAYGGYYGCPVCNDYNGTPISWKEYPVQVEDWDTAWREFSQAREIENYRRTDNIIPRVDPSYFYVRVRS